MEKLSFKLEVFEGPLDVLLHLISKNKLNIYDIPISELLSQYMAYLNAMQEMDLEITSDFLEMASRLVQIKTAMLLPQPEEEGEDPRDDLMGTLIEYQSCKAAAADLRTRAGGFDLFVRAPMKLERDATYSLRHGPRELCEALRGLAVRIRRRQPPPASTVTGAVGQKIVSVASRIVFVLRRLIRKGAVPFSSFFSAARGRSEMVATFLALLELIKSREVALTDDDATVEIRRGRGGRKK